MKTVYFNISTRSDIYRYELKFNDPGGAETGTWARIERDFWSTIFVTILQILLRQQFNKI